MHKLNKLPYRTLTYTHFCNLLMRGVVMVLFEPPGSSDPLCAQENNLRVKQKVFVFLNDKGKIKQNKNWHDVHMKG